MRLLLDTHIWLWSVLEPERLSRRVSKEIQDAGNELWLSPISVWELIVLWEKGRMVPGEDIEAWVPISSAIPAITRSAGHLRSSAGNWTSAACSSRSGGPVSAGYRQSI